MHAMTQTKALTASGLLSAAILTLAALPAHAQSFKINKIEINGVTSVPVQPLRDALKDKPGDKVTTDDVMADQDQLLKSLEAAHVTGGVKTSLRSNANGTKDIIFAVNDTGVQAPVVTTTALHLAHVTFEGNKYLDSDSLTAAAQMKPGDVVTDKSIADALARIGAAYKKATDAKAQIKGKTNISPKISYPQPGQVDVAWQFNETADKAKKKRNTDDEGFKTE
jgi:outer membrane protein assembly factor BamA